MSHGKVHPSMGEGSYTPDPKQGDRVKDFTIKVDDLTRGIDNCKVEQKKMADIKASLNRIYQSVSLYDRNLKGKEI